MDVLTASPDHLHLSTKEQNRSYSQLLNNIYPKYLDSYEVNDIIAQFDRDWVENNQVLWSGVYHPVAEDWAKQHGMQTLTTAMGPLMDWTSPSCLKFTMSTAKWTKYIKGASAIFAWKITLGDLTTLLTPPPPCRLHPSGLTNYQDIEEPILKGVFDGLSVEKILMVHPEIDGAKDYSYEYWPRDEMSVWIEKHGQKRHAPHIWRTISCKRRKEIPANVWTPARADGCLGPANWSCTTSQASNTEASAIVNSGLYLPNEVSLRLIAHLWAFVLIE